MYGFGNIKMCAARALGKAKVDISLDSVKVKEVEMLTVRDDALPYELLIGRSFLDRENISFARIGNKLHVCYAEDNPFANMECERNSVNFVRAQTTVGNDGSAPIFLVNEESCYVNVIKENKRLTEKSEIRIDEETPIEDKREILELVNEVRDCFEMKLSELRCTTLTKIDRIVSRLTNAPTEFQSLSHHVLGPLLNIEALIEKKFDLEVYQTMSVDE
ncbi:hypothetical protein CDAR_601031 [Caerostris darwini]|uniref:Vitellogenin n=1 Tax=Caerostris darwini TaxID=1538125 RepID=A0AAV4VTZ4_9ARAC|nr:hypothetical protein CDAR_601031 [Caerostris darwini]